MFVPSRSQLLAALVLGLSLAGVASTGAQAIELTPDPKMSVAWWQINPHMNHLWASTCPQEPSWRPGEGRSGGWSITQAFRPPKHGDAAVSDTTIIPLYPRRRARAVCSPAVEGKIQVADTTNWTGVSGWITVNANDLVGGDGPRDTYAKSRVFETTKYPQLKFQIDSLVNVTRVRDTVKATAVGVFTFRGVDKPVMATIRSYTDESGRRVLGRFHFPAHDMSSVYGVSMYVLGMGVGSRIWYNIWGGVDLVMRTADRTSASN